MSFRPFLFRLLLCLALVANGATAAYAGTVMAFGAGMDVTTAAGHDAEPPCHDMPEMAHAAMAAGHDAPASPASHDDCCPPGACVCSCVPQASTIPALGAFALPMRPSAAPVATLRVSFASPALPHLIRPPIG